MIGWGQLAELDSGAALHMHAILCEHDQVESSESEHVWSNAEERGQRQWCGRVPSARALSCGLSLSPCVAHLSVRPPLWATEPLQLEKLD